MPVIYKYTLTDHECTLRLPADADLLSVDFQNGTGLVVWALVDPENPVTSRHFAIYATGEPLPDNPGHYVGTATTPAGIVWHVFDRGVS